MAVTWNTQITNVNVVKKRADISFERTDDVLETTEIYSFFAVIIETGPQRAALLDLVWQKHLDYVSQQTGIETFVNGMELAANANLEAREV